MRLFATILLAASLVSALPTEPASNNGILDQDTALTRYAEEISHSEIIPRDDDDLSTKHSLHRRVETTAAMPGLKETVELTIGVATVTLYRMTRDKLHVEITNLTNAAISGFVQWWGLKHAETVPASATSGFQITVADHHTGDVVINLG